MQSKKIRIGLVASTRQVVQMAEKVVNALYLSDQVKIVQASLQECVEVSRRMEQDEYDVILARGGTASRIMAEVSTPVVMIPVTGQEIFQALYDAKSISNRPYPSIAMLPFAGVNVEAELFAKVLGVQLKIYSTENSWDSDIHRVVAHIRDDRPDVVVGGMRCVQLADEQGLKTVFLASSFNSIRDALDDARKVVYAMRLEQARSRRLKVLVDSIREGIFYVDAQGRIQLANPAAQRILGQPLAQILHKPVSEFMDLPGLSKCLRGELHQSEEVVNGNGSTLVASVYALDSTGTGSAALVCIHESRHVSHMEARIKDSLYTQGLTATYSFQDILGQSEELSRTKSLAAEFAALDSNILILGETGSGKELFAQAIHRVSNFSRGPFVAVNCAALPPTLLESELFGYEEGAFTGANRKGKPGLIELSHGGTLFLDEISEMDHYGQIRLLRFLQERQIMRLGGGKYFSVHSRVIAASNRNLKGLAAEGKFREDLYFRLKVLCLHIPSLRQRRGDVPFLLQSFLERWQGQLGQKLNFTKEALRLLYDYPWPGNVREMANVIEFLAVAARKTTVNAELVREALADNDLYPSINSQPILRPERSLAQAEEGESEREKIAAALAESGGRHEEAALLLGIHRSTLFRKMKKYGLKKEVVAAHSGEI